MNPPESGEEATSRAAGVIPPMLRFFAEGDVLDTIGRIAPTPDLPWPKLDGCLVVLFTARSGSTFLTRELEAAFDIGYVGESLNPVKLESRAPQRIVRKLKSSWFAFKAGAPGVISAELCGLMEAYRPRTSFIRLIRKDILAQAVSNAKAVQTRAWHAPNTPVREAAYDGPLIAKSIKRIARVVDQLRDYALETGRPQIPLIYEDFANGDLGPALAAGDALGLPRLPPQANVVPRPVEKVGDAVNEAWIARFAEEMDQQTRDIIDKYVATIGA